MAGEKSDEEFWKNYVETNELNEKRFKCSFCDKEFKVLWDAGIHVKSVHLEIYEACQICGVPYKISYLSKHMRTDHEGKTYECKYCGKELTSNDLHEETCKKKTKKENELPPRGATMFMEGFKDGTTREDIEEALKLQLDIELKSKAFAFVKCVNGKTFANVRFGQENAAFVLAAEMKEN